MGGRACPDEARGAKSQFENRNAAVDQCGQWRYHKFLLPFSFLNINSRY